MKTIKNIIQIFVLNGQSNATVIERKCNLRLPKLSIFVVLSTCLIIQNTCHICDIKVLLKSCLI